MGTQIQSKKLQVFVKKIASPVQEEDDDYLTDRREKELSLGHKEDSSESENEEREAKGREKIPPLDGKSSTEKTEKELRVEAQEKSREEEERKQEEEEKKAERESDKARGS